MVLEQSSAYSHDFHMAFLYVLDYIYRPNYSLLAKFLRNKSASRPARILLYEAIAWILALTALGAMPFFP